MVNENLVGLGRSLTTLRLEDRFLSNGELSRFPLMDRGRIINGIIDEKLRMGRWESVINMIYGRLGKADALYEGDRNELRERIVKSAIEYPKSKYIGIEIVESLTKAGENDLLFNLAINIPSLDYDSFMAVIRKINKIYFEEEGIGNQRKQALNKKAGRKALEERKYDSAFYHFEQAGDRESIAGVFDAALSVDNRYSSGGLLEKIALSDSSHKDERLRKAVLSAILDEKGLELLSAYELFKKHEVKLSSKEESDLKRRVAKKANRYDIERKFSKDSEIKLLWAKNHTKDEPRAAYNIFLQQGFEGPLVVTAVNAGLAMKSYEHEDKYLRVGEVKEQHLKRAYESAPFEVKVKIAMQLKDSVALLELSKQSYKAGNLNEAYSLWIAGNGELNGEHIEGLRRVLIEDAIENHCGYMNFLDNSDSLGMRKAYDVLMSAEKGKRADNLRSSYDIALKLGDEDKMQRTREAMVAIDLNWAIRNFTGKSEGIDENGVDYALGAVASENGADFRELKRIFIKYQSA